MVIRHCLALEWRCLVAFGRSVLLRNVSVSRACSGSLASVAAPRWHRGPGRYRRLRYTVCTKCSGSFCGGEFQPTRATARICHWDHPGFLFVRRPVNGSHPAGWERGCTALALLAGAVLIGSWFAFAGRNLGYGQPAKFALIFAALIFGLAGSSSGISRVLSVRPFVLLGDASYALYLLHGTLLELVGYASRNLSWFAAVAQQPWFLPLFVIAAIGASLLVLLVVERPARVALRSALTRPNSPAAKQTSMRSTSPDGAVGQLS